jgi:DNA-binding transcriptional MocR family regulator
VKSVALAVEESTPSGIAGAIARLITSGDLAPGDRLPTVRVLAADLGVSPATVSHAWQALAGVGLIVSRGRSGSFVREERTAWLPPRSRGLRDSGQPAARLDLASGTPDPALLPDIGPALSRLPARAGTSNYYDVPVLPELERVLRASWPYEVEGLTVVDGAMDAISRTLDLVVRYGDRVVVENPGFPPVFDLLEHYGVEQVPVELDEHGIRPESLAEALALSPSAIVLQPRTHNPAGVSTTAGRARELATIIRSTRTADRTIVIEDDHSGEISASPDVSLGEFLPDRVMHIRSFAKSHGPDLRIAAVGGPRELVDRLVARRILGPGWTSRLLQTVLHDLLTDAATIAGLDRARMAYRDRQFALGAALAANGVELPVPDGINLWLPVNDERNAVVQLAAAGIRVAPGAPVLSATPTPAGDFVRVTAGLVDDGVDALAGLLAAAARA